MIRNLALCGVAAVLSIFAAGCVTPSSDDSLNTAPDKQALSHGGEGGGKKITICHVPPGNPANAHSISISKSALAAHLAHGDNIGKCQHDDDGDDDGDHDDGGGCGGGSGGAGGGTTTSTTSTTTSTGTGTGGGLGGGGGVGGSIGGSTDTGTTSVTDTGAGGSTGTTDTGSGGAGGSTGTFTITGTDTGTITGTDTGTTTSNVCSSDGVACGSSAECCSGICGGSGICTAACTQGPEAGDAFCAQDLDCCSGVCMWGNCLADMVCWLPASPCDGATDCCFGLVCTDGTCQ